MPSAEHQSLSGQALPSPIKSAEKLYVQVRREVIRAVRSPLSAWIRKIAGDLSWATRECQEPGGLGSVYTYVSPPRGHADTRGKARMPSPNLLTGVPGRGVRLCTPVHIHSLPSHQAPDQSRSLANLLEQPPVLSNHPSNFLSCQSLWHVLHKVVRLLGWFVPPSSRGMM